MLRAAGWIYGKIADLRNGLYDRNLFKRHNLGARTISIGNITVGGTGKTPLVAYVASILADAGENVCILTRGYGRSDPGSRVLISDGETVLADAHQGGDEPVELARKLIGKAIVVADANRVSAAMWAKSEFGITAFVLDDAFQHRRAERDLDIVCIDATDPCGGGRVVPAGRLRERFRNIRRADAVVVTRSDLVESTADIRSRIRNRNPNADVFESRMSITTLRRLGSEADHDERLAQAVPQRVLAFCGIGNPDAFFEQLRGWLADLDGRFELVATQAFPDHHRYSQTDVARLEESARNASADVMITTAKDSVKLETMKLTIPCYSAHIEISIDDPQRFRDLILSSR